MATVKDVAGQQFPVSKIVNIDKGDNPEEVIQLARQVGAVTVRGGHELFWVGTVFSGTADGYSESTIREMCSSW